VRLVLALVLLLLLALLPGCGSPDRAAAPVREPLDHINLTENWPYPFSSAVRAGDMLYLSGQIGTVNKGDDGGAPKLVPGGIEPETRQTMENIKAVLTKSGSSLDRVVQCTVMMADMSEWPAMNKIYAEYFPGPKPARGAFGASGLALGARVEIMCIAALGSARR
jgi:reactive intermediate/imine deaminase